MSEKPAYPSDTADKVLVRMPDGMREQLKAAAKANNRTMNAEIVARLQASFDAPVLPDIVSNTRPTASTNDLALLYEITEAQMHLQQATMNLSDAKDDAFRVSVVLERRERELRDAEEAGQDEALLAVRKEAYNKAQKDFKAAQRAVMDAKNDVHAKQSALSELHLRRAAETNLPSLRAIKSITT